MNADKLAKMQQQVRIGGKGTVRRKKKVVRRSSTTDDKKLQSSLKKLSVNNISGIEEVNMIKDDGSVIHFNNPKVQASLNANTFAISGHAENKQITEMLPGILNHLGSEGFNQLKRLASTVNANKFSSVTSTGIDEDDDVPELVEDFEAASKNETGIIVNGESRLHKDDDIPRLVDVGEAHNQGKLVDINEIIKNENGSANKGEDIKHDQAKLSDSLNKSEFGTEAINKYSSTELNQDDTGSGMPVLSNNNKQELLATDKEKSEILFSAEHSTKNEKKSKPSNDLKKESVKSDVGAKKVDSKPQAESKKQDNKTKKEQEKCNTKSKIGEPQDSKPLSEQQKLDSPKKKTESKPKVDLPKQSIENLPESGKSAKVLDLKLQASKKQGKKNQNDQKQTLAEPIKQNVKPLDNQRKPETKPVENKNQVKAKGNQKDARVHEEQKQDKLQADQKKQDTKAQTDQKKQDAKAHTDQKKQDTKAQADPKKPDTVAEAEQKKQDTKAKVNQKKQDTKAQADQTKPDTKAQTDQKKQDTKSLADQKKQDTNSLADQKKQDTNSPADQKKQDTNLLIDQKKQDTKSLADQKKQHTKAQADQKKQDTKSQADQKNQDTKSQADQKNQDTKSQADQKNQDTKSQADQKKQDTKSQADQKKLDTKSQADQKKLDTKSQADQKKPDTKSQADQKKQDAEGLAEKQDAKELDKKKSGVKGIDEKKQGAIGLEKTKQKILDVKGNEAPKKQTADTHIDKIKTGSKGDNDQRVKDKENDNKKKQGTKSSGNQNLVDSKSINDPIKQNVADPSISKAPAEQIDLSKERVELKTEKQLTNAIPDIGDVEKGTTISEGVMDSSINSKEKKLSGVESTLAVKESVPSIISTQDVPSSQIGSSEAKLKSIDVTACNTAIGVNLAHDTQKGQ